jgi:hypothetical protein
MRNYRPLSDEEWLGLVKWFQDNKERWMEVCRFLARICQGYNNEDERWLISRRACDKIRSVFGDEVKVAEQRGFDIKLRLAKGRWIRVSLKVLQHAFQESFKRDSQLLKPKSILMTNPKSEGSARKQRRDFDLLLVLQRGPLKNGGRKGRFIIGFAAVPNSDWLQGKYQTNSDSQQIVRISDKEWEEHGHICGEREEVPERDVLLASTVKRIERTSRRKMCRCLSRQLAEMDRHHGSNGE